jgi:tetratricopeptide (TPR) repeat protein
MKEKYMMIKRKITLSLFIQLFIVLIAPCVNAENSTKIKKQELTLQEQRKLDYFFYEGIKLKKAEKFDSAFEMFNHCLSIDSTSSASMFELSSLYLLFNKPEQAVPLMKKAVEYSHKNDEYHNTLATLLFNMGMYGEAAEEYELLVKRSPERPELNYFLAESYTRMGEIEKAIETFDALENLLGINEALSMEKYQLYMALEETDNAFNELLRLSGKFPMESRYPIMIGDIYLNRNDTVQALTYYRKAYEIDPQSPHYPVSMSHYYEMTGQREAAKEQINQALINDRLDVNTKLNILARFIVQLQRTKQDIESADTLFQTLLQQHPDDSRLKLTYGDFLASTNKLDDARFQYQLIAESEPENITAWQQLLRLSLQQGNMDDVISICQRCMILFPDANEFSFYLGIAYYQQGKYLKAIDTYQKAIPEIPAENKSLISDFYGQIGDSYFNLKDTGKAFEFYEKALSFNENNIVVLNNYAYYLSLLKRELTKAERMSAMCIKIEPENTTYIDTYAWIFFVQGNYSLAKVYIEQAIAKDQANNSELIDHYGDILYMIGEKEKAVEQWVKAKEAGKNSETLNKKIEQKQYFEETIEELLNNNAGLENENKD